MSDGSSVHAPSYLRSKEDKQLHLIADFLEEQLAVKTEKQTLIDELYSKVWNLAEETDSLKREILEIGEKMKDLVSQSVFK